jgi:hypothetical protein
MRMGPPIIVKTAEAIGGLPPESMTETK